jgi:P27 family predicted phage terminase small subunit
MGGPGSGGHNAKPKILKLREGTFRRDRDRNSPQPASRAPQRPSWLDPEAKREWSRVVPVLERLGLLAEIDRVGLAVYCQAWARRVQCEKVLAERGTTYTNDKGEQKSRPELRIADGYTQELRRFAQQYGLTPSSRGRIQLPEGESEANDDLD